MMAMPQMQNSLFIVPQIHLVESLVDVSGLGASISQPSQASLAALILNTSSPGLVLTTHPLNIRVAKYAPGGPALVVVGGSTEKESGILFGNVKIYNWNYSTNQLVWSDSANTSNGVITFFLSKNGYQSLSGKFWGKDEPKPSDANWIGSIKLLWPSLFTREVKPSKKTCIAGRGGVHLSPPAMAMTMSHEGYFFLFVRTPLGTIVETPNPTLTS